MKAGADRKYTTEFRDAALKQVEAGGRSMTAVAASAATSSAYTSTRITWSVCRASQISGGSTNHCAPAAHTTRNPTNATTRPMLAAMFRGTGMSATPVPSPVRLA